MIRVCCNNLGLCPGLRPHYLPTVSGSKDKSRLVQPYRLFPSHRSPTHFYDNRDNRNNGLIVNSMLSVDNNKNNFYQPKGWLPLDTTFTFVMDNALLHPGCRCALPWAMFFCAYSACWSIYFLRTSSPRIEMVERLPQPRKYFMPCAYGSRRLRQRQSR